MKALCLLIVVFTLSVVLTTAGFILKTSMRSDLSNMALINRYLEKPAGPLRAATEPAVITPSRPVPVYVFAASTASTKKIPEKQVATTAEENSAETPDMPDVNVDILVGKLQEIKDVLLRLQNTIVEASTSDQFPSESLTDQGS